jgi:hypothetical protein
MIATIDSTTLIEGLNAKFSDESEFSSNLFEVIPGRKFDKITQATQNGSHCSVHAFVERMTGHVYKAAGWAKPATGIRYTDVDDAIEAADLYGRYLYSR